MTDISIGRHTILIGNVLDRLKELPSDSVHVVVTSPPYFGLRSYGTEPQVWGGDPSCAHEWVERRYYVEGGGGAKKSGEAFSQPGEANAQRIKDARWREDGLCVHCGAWHGHLGLEPTLAMFIEHLVAVFREVRRVLRPDGTCWINLGDSFYSGGSNASRSRPVQRESPCGKVGTERQGYRQIDPACLRLCDGCRDALSRRNSGNDQQHHESVSPRGQTTRDSGHRDSFSATLDGVPLVALESTSLESSQPPLGECWHCDNCGACLSVLGSSSRDVRLCARMAACTSGNERPASERHTQDKDALGLALAEPPYIQPQYTMSLKPKDLMMVPARLAIALQEDCWYLRSDIIWHKKAPMPESVTDRPTSAHEHVFLLAKSARYYYDADAVREEATYGYRHDPNDTPRSGRNAQSSGVWRNAGTATEGVERGRDQTGSTYNKDSGRNMRNVWHLGEPLFKLRDDLTPEQRAYVFERLAAQERRGLA